MTFRTKMMTTAGAAALIASPMAATLAIAEQSINPVYQTQDAMLEVSPGAIAALTQAHGARLALFDNDLDAAVTHLNEAIAIFESAQDGIGEFVVSDWNDVQSDANFIPLEATMTLDEGYAPSEEDQHVLALATQLYQNGQDSEAIDMLRESPIELLVSTAMLPVEGALDQWAQAQTLIEDGYYYEANLALKAVEESIVVQSFALDAIPAQGVDAS